ncbi:MAG: hypothetical protein DMG74_17895 [Acidobacteria bacterium]|nr:MAG: hypothetical protein DMG74_17895 [Acidobacteriota bacterium]
MNSELLTIEEASDLLRLRPSTLRAWILHRRVPYVKFSRRVFLRRSDVEELITGGLVPAAAPSGKCTGFTEGRRHGEV